MLPSTLAVELPSQAVWTIGALVALVAAGILNRLMPKGGRR